MASGTSGASANPVTVTVAGKPVPRHLLLVLVGAAWWLGLMVIRTGASGLASIADALWVMGLFVVAGSLTRTVSIRQLFVMFLYGGFMMGISVVLAKLVGAMVSGNRGLEALMVPTMEQVLMLVPPAVLLWKGRKSWLWCLGATDVFLLALASGLGFEMVENAYIRAAGRWASPLIPWFPLSITSGDRIHGEHLFNGHALWSGLTGLAVGMALLLRSRGRLAWALGGAGFVLGLLDHIALDYRAAVGANALEGLLSLLTARGYVVLGLFFVGLLVALFADGSVIYGSVPADVRERLRRLRLPLGSGAWGWMLTCRELAFAAFQAGKCSGIHKEEASLMRDVALIRLIDMHAKLHLRDGKGEPLSASVDGPEPQAVPEAPPPASSVIGDDSES
ncbi:MAG TPA: PrsW family glutamic-type intramembrane protease [Candidatus Obscuribacterales bacterium]